MSSIFIENDGIFSLLFYFQDYWLELFDGDVFYYSYWDLWKEKDFFIVNFLKF